MPRKKKGFQAATSSSNRVNQSKTFKLSEEQTKRLNDSGELERNTFSAIARSFFDDQFDQKEFYRKFPDLSMQISDLSLLIGDGVNATDVVACLQAIIDNEPWPVIRTTAKADSYYKAFFDEKALDRPIRFLRDYCERVIEDHINIYFLHVFQRKAIFRMASLINQSLVANLTDKVNANAFAGAFHDFEGTWLFYRVSLSLRLRFAMYCCQKIEVFGSRGSASASFQSVVNVARKRYGFGG